MIKERFKNVLVGLGAVEGVSMKEMTTFAIGGEARLWIDIYEEGTLFQVMDICMGEGIPWVVLGRGSKVLVADKGFEGVVIHLAKDDLEVSGANIVADGATPLAKILKVSLEAELTGFEFAYGIPGSAGGAVRMNAGTYMGQMGNVLRKIRVYKAGVGVVEREIGLLPYRNGRIEEDEIVLRVHLQLRKGDREEIAARIDELKRYRLETQPQGLPSAGCIFKNPPGAKAGELIEKAGLKGMRIGGAEISQKHANFIVNLGDASAEDVRELVKLAKRAVYEKFGLLLEEEIVYIGFEGEEG